jgi:hypothetical protein
MPNGNLHDEVICPNCHQARMVRRDVIKRNIELDKPLICKPCHNRMRFENKDHSRKGMGVKNNPELKRTRDSFYKAKARCKLGKKHHLCYEAVEFKLNSLQELIDCIGIRPIGCTIDRINPLGNYEVGNIRWATSKQQAENRLPRNYWKNQLDKPI